MERVTRPRRGVFPVTGHTAATRDSKIVMDSKIATPRMSQELKIKI